MSLILSFGFGSASLAATGVVIAVAGLIGGRAGGLAALGAGVGGLTDGAGEDLAEFDADAESFNDVVAFTCGAPVDRGFGDCFGGSDKISLT